MNYRAFFCGVFLSLATCNATFAQSVQAMPVRPALDLPNISVIGLVNSTFTSGQRASLSVDEVEFTFQNVIFPGVRADVFAALHKEEDGTRAFELEEAYVTFSDIFDLALPSAPSWLEGFGAIVGQKRLTFGKVSPLHPEQWAFINRPDVLVELLGGREGFAFEGISVSHSLPTPFFAQLELGTWQQPLAHAHPEEEEDEDGHGHESTGPAFQDRTYTSRLWTSFKLGDSQELELGTSAVWGKGPDDSDTTIIGGDLTWTRFLKSNRFFRVQGELLSTTYSADHDHEESRAGGYLYAGYHMARQGYLGLRLDGVEGSSDVDSILRYSLIACRQLSETTRFRTQLILDRDAAPTLLFQMIFGFGPHFHTIQ